MKNTRSGRDSACIKVVKEQIWHGKINRDSKGEGKRKGTTSLKNWSIGMWHAPITTRNTAERRKIISIEWKVTTTTTLGETTTGKSAMWWTWVDDQKLTGSRTATVWTVTAGRMGSITNMRQYD